MSASGFNDELRTLAVTGWQESTRNIQVPELPFALHVSIELEPAFVDLTTACGSSEPVFLKLSSSSTVRFREEGIEVEGQLLQNPIIFGETVQPGTDIIVGLEAIAPGTLKTCIHGFAPPSRCPVCGTSQLSE